MKIHLYKVACLDGIGHDSYTIVETTNVVDINGLRDEFLNVLNNGEFSVKELLDYAKDPDYSKEDWDDMGNLSAGTMVDMLNDMVDYGGTYYLVLETDLEIKD